MGSLHGALALPISQTSAPALRLVVEERFDASVVAAAVNERERLRALASSGLLHAGVEPFFDRLTILAASLLKAPTAAITLVHRDGQFLLSGCGVPEPYATDRGSALSQSVCKFVVAGRRTLAVDDLRRHPVLRSHPAVAAGMIAYLGVPLVTSDGHVLGALCVTDFRPRRWAKNLVRIVEQLAESTVTEIELRTALHSVRESRAELERANAQLYTAQRDADDRARHDVLTGLLNRRGFLEAAEASKALDGEGIVLFADLDGLKAINDGLGHDAGDAAISAAAEVMRRALGGGDIIGRLGGDELAAYLPGADAAAGERVLARVQEETARFNESAGRPWKLSISAGYVAICEESIDTALAEADARMYAIKRARR